MCGAFRVYGVSEFSSGDGMHREKPDAPGSVKSAAGENVAELRNQALSIAPYCQFNGQTALSAYTTCVRTSMSANSAMDEIEPPSANP